LFASAYIKVVLGKINRHHKNVKVIAYERNLTIFLTAQ